MFFVELRQLIASTKSVHLPQLLSDLEGFLHMQTEGYK